MTKKKKMARAMSKNRVNDPGPSWPSCLYNVSLQWTVQIKDLAACFVQPDLDLH